MERAKQQPARTGEPVEKSSLNYEQKRIAAWLKGVRFKKKLFGGVSEVDVWRKLDELNSMYDAALNAERVRYDTMLNEIRTELYDRLKKAGRL